jgi:hypothetical protein
MQVIGCPPESKMGAGLTDVAQVVATQGEVLRGQAKMRRGECPWNG